jgi:hypothetical protein
VGLPVSGEGPPLVPPFIAMLYDPLEHSQGTQGTSQLRLFVVFLLNCADARACVFLSRLTV